MPTPEIPCAAMKPAEEESVSQQTMRITDAVPSSKEKEKQSDEQLNKEYPSGFKFASIIAAVCLSFAIVGLDSTILVTAVPTMTRYFGTIADISCRLTAGSFQFTFGKLYTLFPAKPIVLVSLGIFAVGALASALAPSSPVFIFGRAAARGLSAWMSGVMVLPSAVGLIFSVSLAGFLTSIIGYYKPFTVLTGVIAPIAAGLMTTLGVDTPLWSLIFYQALLGFGAGIGFQGPQVAVQTIFSDKDSQIGLAIIQFAQGIGPAVFVAAAQAIFTNRLAANLEQCAQGTDLAELTRQGLAAPEDPSNHDTGIALSYSKGITQTFCLAAALAGVSLLGALSMESRSVKRMKPNLT
ncbi:hypothetical protein DL769_007643 [Monosporascus sp. CRB-8-3]|nr:hypothetical protein DL769_007643 [Monosporascus sp. CRB-8-3]